MIVGYKAVASSEECRSLKLSVEFKPTDEKSRFSFIPTTGAALLLVDAVGEPNFGLTLDVGHTLAAGENPAQSIAMAASRNALFGVQLGDGHTRLGAEDGLMFASVHPHAAMELVRALRRISYAGVLYFDTFPLNEDPVAEAERNARVFRDFYARIVDVEARPRRRHRQPRRHSRSRRRVTDVIDVIPSDRRTDDARRRPVASSRRSPARGAPGVVSRRRASVVAPLARDNRARGARSSSPARPSRAMSRDDDAALVRTPRRSFDTTKESTPTDAGKGADDRATSPMSALSAPSSARNSREGLARAGSEASEGAKLAWTATLIGDARASRRLTPSELRASGKEDGTWIASPLDADDDRDDDATGSGRLSDDERVELAERDV